MFFLFFLIWKLKADDKEKCNVGLPSKLAQYLYKTYQTMAPSFGIVGFGAKFSQNPIYEFDLNRLHDYLGGIVDMTLVLVLLYAFLVLILACSTCWCFCCCRPERSNGVTCRGACIHLMFIVFMAVGLVLFYIACVDFIKGIDSASDIETNINTSITNATDIFNSVVNTSFDQINSLITTSKETFTTFINDVDTTLENISTNVDSAVSTSEVAKNYSENDLNSSAKEVNEKFKTECSGNGTLIDNDLITEKLSEIYEKMKKFQENIQQINGTKDKIKKSINEIDQNIQDKVDEFENKISSSVNSNINKISKYTNVSKLLDGKIDMVISYAQKYVKPNVINAVIVASVIIAIYTFIYFSNKCCCKFFAASYPFFALIFTLVLGIPGIIFVVVVPTLYSGCPKAEGLIANNTPIGQYADNVPAVLLCNDKEKSLVSLLKLDEKLKIYEKLDEFEKKLNGTLEEVYANESIEALGNASEINRSSLNFDELTELIGKKEELKQKTEQCNNKQEVQNKIDEYFNKLQELKSKMSNMNESVSKSIEYAGTIGPQLKAATETTQTLLEKFIETFYINFIETLGEKLTCNLVCSVYVPIKNAVCEKVLNGASFWIISAIIMIIAIIQLFSSICNRRKDMKDPEESDDESSSFFVITEESD